MKKVAIVSFERLNSQLIAQILENLFGDMLSCRLFDINDTITDVSHYDIVLYTSDKILDYLRASCELDDNRLLFVQMTFEKENIRYLVNLPSNTRALFISNSKEAAEEIISTIYSMGMKNLELYPYYPGIESYERLPEGIVTHNSLNHVPDCVREVTDIGNRGLDPMFLLELLSKLNMLNELNLKTVSNYSYLYLSMHEGYFDMCVSAFESKMKLNAIINNISDGILTYDKNKSIKFFNNNCEKIFNITESHVLNKNVRQFLAEYGVRNVTDEDRGDLIINVRGKSYAVSVKNDNIINEVVVIFSNIGEIKEIQNKYLKFLKAGHVAKYSFNNIIGESNAMRKTVDTAKKFALSDLPVLIEGNSGTGKELFASAIHNYSARKDKPFVAFNCAALNENLLESELFGYNEGAFTGAAKNGKEGLFEIADGGTVFLDEIGDMPFGLQAKLLRVLQEKEIIKVGAINIIPINIRIIAATNKNLHQLVEEGTFREDLYYRLCTLCLRIPSLKERTDDLNLLIDYFQDKYDAKFSLSNQVRKMLLNYEWPGNVREAESYVQYAKILNKPVIETEDLPNNICEHFKMKVKESDVLDAADREILAALHGFYLDNKKAGRGKIADVLRKRNMVLSEQEVRTRLYGMQSKGLVAVRKGRGGTTITSEGIKYVERML